MIKIVYQLLFDIFPGLIRLQQLFDFIVTSNLDIEVKVIEVPSDPDEIYNQLRTIDLTYEKGNKPVLLDLPNDVSEIVLKKQDRDTWRVSFHYVLMGLVSCATVVCMKCLNSSFSFVIQKGKYSNPCVCFRVPWNLI